MNVRRARWTRWSWRVPEYEGVGSRLPERPAGYFARQTPDPCSRTSWRTRDRAGRWGSGGADQTACAAQRTPATRDRLRRLVGLLVSVIVLPSGACSQLPRPSSQQVVDRPANDNDQVTLYDAGEVLSGTRIQHAFRFQNRTDGALWLASHDDIRPSCGCASARVVDHQLAPGEATEICVQIQTDGRRGPLSEVVAVVWTAQDGRRLEFAFAIRGQIQSALVLVPDELTFDRQEVVAAGEQARRVHIGSAAGLEYGHGLRPGRFLGGRAPAAPCR